MFEGEDLNEDDLHDHPVEVWKTHNCDDPPKLWKMVSISVWKIKASSRTSLKHEWQKAGRGHGVELCPPKNMVKLSPLVPVPLIVFRNKVSADVIKLGWDDSGAEWLLYAVTCVLIWGGAGLETWDHRREEATWRQRRRLELGCYKPRNPRSDWELEGARQGSFLEPSEGEQPVNIPADSRLQNCERVECYCFKPPTAWYFATAAGEQNCFYLENKSEGKT